MMKSKQRYTFSSVVDVDVEESIFSSVCPCVFLCLKPVFGMRSLVFLKLYLLSENKKKKNKQKLEQNFEKDLLLPKNGNNAVVPK